MNAMKVIKFLLFIVCAIMIYLTCLFFIGTSFNPYYSSVKSYIKDNPTSFYDFYDIDSYLTGGEKKTLSDINRLSIYYNVDPKDNYNITIKKDKYEITYRMDTADVSENELKNNIFIHNKYPIYIENTEIFIYAEHYLDNGICLSVSISQPNNTFDVLSLQNTLIKLLEDSIDLNKQTH